MSRQVVKFDIGGVYYKVSLQTLLVKPDSYFSALFNGNWNEEKDENGRIFIDRDGKAFEYVLDFLRNGIKMVLPDSPEMKRRVRREADFYILPELAEFLDADVNLDIGGSFYATSVKTLSVEGSYFPYLLNTYAESSQNGRLFIDRDGDAFKYILDFLKNGTKMVLPESVEMSKRVRREAYFYSLAEIVDLLSTTTDVVKLDVGGIKYSTSVKTLSVQGSYFLHLLNGNVSRNDRILIDRDGKAFEYVLDFLRKGKRMVFPDNPEMKQRIRQEAQFYKLPQLQDLLDNMKNRIKIRIKGTDGFSNFDRVVELSLAQMKSFPGSWFDETFSNDGHVGLEQDENGAYLLQCHAEAKPSALVVEFVAGNLNFNEINSSNIIGLVYAVNFFRLPHVVIGQISKCMKFHRRRTG